MKDAVINAQKALIEDTILNLPCEEITNLLRKLGLWDDEIYVSGWHSKVLEEAHDFAVKRSMDFLADIPQGNDYYVVVTIDRNERVFALGFHEERDEFMAHVPVAEAAQIIFEQKRFDEFFLYLPQDLINILNDNNPLVNSFYVGLNDVVGHEVTEEMRQTYSFLELLKLTPDQILEKSGNYSPTGHWKWVAKCESDDNFDDHSEQVFRNIEDAYNNMRKAALNKMKWNTEYNTDFDDGRIDYHVVFNPMDIQHSSYSGVYTYRIVPATFEDIKAENEKLDCGCSFTEAIKFIAMYGWQLLNEQKKGFDFEFELDGWSGEVGLIEDWAGEFYEEVRDLNWFNQCTTIYDEVDTFIRTKIQYIKDNPNTAYMQYRVF